MTEGTVLFDDETTIAVAFCLVPGFVIKENRPLLLPFGATSFVGG